MTLNEMRAELVRQQAAHLEVNNQLRATPTGTDAFGQLARQLQQLDATVKQARARLESAMRNQPGPQTPLL